MIVIIHNIVGMSDLEGNNLILETQSAEPMNKRLDNLTVNKQFYNH